MHKRLIEIKVDENFTVESRKREFSDKYIKIIAGIGFIMGLFGAFAILKKIGGNYKNKTLFKKNLKGRCFSKAERIFYKFISEQSTRQKKCFLWFLIQKF